MTPGEDKATPIKRVRQVCRCTKCGNEAEMEFTCRLEPEEKVPAGGLAARPPSMPGGRPTQARGTATCAHCGNEAEMWIDV